MEERDNHLGHRERMREKFNVQGAEVMSSQEVLEILLYQCIPRMDTSKISAELIKTFDSFSGVLNAPVRELMTVDGVGKSTAEFIHSLPSFMRYYQEDLHNADVRIYNTDSAYQILKNKFYGRKTEIIVAMILNSRGQIVYNNIITEGSVSIVPVYIKKIIQLCIDYDADTVILAHNHPSGNPAPSKGDIISTKEVQMALDSIYVSLGDHLIFTDTDYTSMKKSGWLDDISRSMMQFRQSTFKEALIAENIME